MDSVVVDVVVVVSVVVVVVGVSVVGVGTGSCAVGVVMMAGAVTVTSDLARSLPCDAVMVALPDLTPRTTPVALTVTTDDEEDHEIVRPDSGAPFRSRMRATSLAESP